MLNIFSCAYWTSVCPLWKNLSSGQFLSGLFVLILLSIISCLWILETNPLLVTSFIIIFSQSVGCLFILFIVLFAVQKLLSRSYLFSFVCFSIFLGDELIKILLWFMSESVLSMFPSRNFIVSSLTFRSLIQFELIFWI